MFKAFPIIVLADQLNAINDAILKYKLSRQDVLDWFDIYGELVMPSKSHSIKSFNIFPLLFLKTIDGYRLVYCFKSGFDGWKIFRFAFEQRIIIVASSLNARFYDSFEYLVSM